MTGMEMGAMGMVLVFCVVGLGAVAVLGGVDAKSRRVMLIVGACAAAVAVSLLLVVNTRVATVEQTAVVVSASDEMTESQPLPPQRRALEAPAGETRSQGRPDTPSMGSTSPSPDAPGAQATDDVGRDDVDGAARRRSHPRMPGPMGRPMPGPMRDGRTVERTFRSRPIWMPLVVPVMLTVGAVLWLVRSPRARRVVALGVVIALAASLPILAGLLWLEDGAGVEGDRTMLPQAVPQAGTGDSARDPQRRSAMESGAGWRDPEQGGAFLADVYPSRDLALEALLGGASGGLVALLPAGGGMADGNAPAAELIVSDRAKFKEVLRWIAQGPPAVRRVRVRPAPGDGGEAGDPNASNAVFSLTETRRNDGEGEFLLKARWPDGHADEATTVRYVDKPWAASFEVWREDERYRLGVSSATCATVDEARREAYASVLPDVVERIEDLILREQRAGKLPSQRHGLTASEPRIRSALLGRPGRLDVGVTDRFLQAYERPYGTVYRQWLLVDLEDEDLPAEARQVAGELSERSARRAYAWIMRVGLSLGVVLTTILCYLLLDGLTKGYYRWWVRGATALVLLAGLAIVMRISSGL